jgi:pilus assembly protein CpaE
MTPSVTILGSTDRRLEEMVRACGVRMTGNGNALELITLGGEPPAEQPDVVLVDARASAHAPTSLAGVRVRYPQAGVVLVAGTLDPVLMLEAMRAGVNECVVEPLTTMAVADALTRVLAVRGAPAGQLIAFVGAKGGVGTTTLAVNVATSLAASGPSLVLDCNPCFGDAAIMMSAEPRYSVFDALENTHRLDQSFFEGLAVHTAAGPWLLPSPVHPSAAAMDPNRVRLLLEFALRHYRYTVLDVPRINRAVLESLSGATAIVVVTTQELASVRAASTLADMLRRRYGREKTSVVITRYDRNAEIGRDDVEMAVHGEVHSVLPNDYRAAVEALNLGQPFAGSKGSPLADAVIDFARVITGQVPRPAGAPAATGSWLERLTTLRWHAGV